MEYLAAGAASRTRPNAKRVADSLRWTPKNNAKLRPWADALFIAGRVDLRRWVKSKDARSLHKAVALHITNRAVLRRWVERSSVK